MLLRNANVRKWIVGDTGFLKDMTNCKSKLNEDTWGREVLKMARPDRTCHLEPCGLVNLVKR